MTTRELYRLAYRRRRVVANINRTAHDNPHKYDALQPIAIPAGIISAARASFDNKTTGETIDPLQLGERFVGL